MEQIWLRFGQIIKNSINAISSLKFSSVIKTCIIMMFLLAILFIYNIIQSNLIVNIVEQRLQEIQAVEPDTTQDVETSINARFNVSPQIDSEINLLLEKLHADRIIISEFHNSVANIGNLHFAYFSATYEAIDTDNPKIEYLSNQFQNINTSLFRITNYVYVHNYLACTLDELKQVDKRYAVGTELDNMKYFAFHIIKSIDGQPIGMIHVAWRNEANVKHADLRNDLLAAALKLGNYLSYKKTQVEAM